VMKTLERAWYRWKMGVSDAGRVGEDLGKLGGPKSDSFTLSASESCVISGGT
jgi:hypothetical protein